MSSIISARFSEVLKSDYRFTNYLQSSHDLKSHCLYPREMRMAPRLFMVAIFALAGVAAQAQTICPDPVAQVISPTPGSTLPAGAVTFTWCHANKGDYFLDIESVPGAHEIFFA